MLLCLLLSCICVVVGKPFGQHNAYRSSCEVLTSIPSPKTFWNEYVLKDKAVLLKGAVVETPAYKLWNDGYLRKKLKDWRCDVDVGLKEHHKKSERVVKEMKFTKFLQGNTTNFFIVIHSYQDYNDTTEELYLVEGVPYEIRDDLGELAPFIHFVYFKILSLELLPSLMEGGFHEFLDASMLWFSGGRTKSVLHHDEFYNLHCVYDGTKTFHLMNHTEVKDMVANKKNGYRVKHGNFAIDVDNVDTELFEGFAVAPHFDCVVDKGSCLFIPARMFHQVTSQPGRNLAVNVWWSEGMDVFDETKKLEDGNFGRLRFKQLDVVE